MKKILVVFGTRPEAIKIAPLLIELKKYPNFFKIIVCVTGQHRQMLDQVLEFFKIKPDIDLDVMTANQTLNDLTSNVLSAMTKVIIENKPDIMIVHGDTTSSFASSLAAFYKNIPVAHVEAGLRTYNMSAPFPEEFNRKIVGNIAKYHFAPTDLSKNNLITEGVLESKIWVTGNTVIDALNLILDEFKNNCNYSYATTINLKKILGFDFIKNKFILVTGHRRENFGQGFQNICMSLKTLSKKYPEINFVYPAHLNPMVIKPVNMILENLNNVRILKPLIYQEFIFLLKHSYGVLTDSGGLQEEASSLGVPVLVMRDITERPEAIKSGIIKMVGTKKNKIITNVSELLENRDLYKKIANPNSIYGDGHASKRIIETLKDI